MNFNDLTCGETDQTKTTETGILRKILKETRMLRSRHSMSHFFIVCKIYSVNLLHSSPWNFGVTCVIPLPLEPSVQVNPKQQLTLIYYYFYLRSQYFYSHRHLFIMNNIWCRVGFCKNVLHFEIIKLFYN